MIRTDYLFGNMLARYLRDEDSGRVSLVLLPADRSQDAFDARRAMLGVPEMVRIGMDAPAWQVGSLVHLAVRGEAQGNGAGNTLKYGASIASLRFASQERQGDTIITRLQSDGGYEITHRLTWMDRCFRVQTQFRNLRETTLDLDLLTSFSLDNLSPYLTADAANLQLHRFRGGWSMEGLHIADSVEQLNLAGPWNYPFPESERFGVIGSHPCKRYFPVCAVEDPDAGVFWGACLDVPGSWQMELSRDSDCFSLSGGVGDCESSLWSRRVLPGETYCPPCAWLAVDASLDGVCQALTRASETEEERIPESEKTLPVVFNEWCTTWGNPSHDRMLALADSLADTHIKYLVIDAGWTDVIPFSFGQGGNGDWNYARDRFPGGLLPTSRALREKGFITGIWFEFEVTTQGAHVYGHQFDDLHLQRGGKVLVTGNGRSFWDFRKPEVFAYLQEKVIDFLRDNEIGYLKVDYNGSIGAGCDGAESLGQGLQEHLDAVLRFFDSIHEQLPSLVLESCASGGHRLTAPFLRRCAMASFSDAHEGKEIPVIAARLHPLVPVSKLQIWAVLHDYQSIRELGYRLASGFLGRLCLSGEVDRLTAYQQAFLNKALALYERAAPVIKDGRTELSGTGSRSLQHLTGWQGVLRIGSSGAQAMAVVHTFCNPENCSVSVSLPRGEWEIVNTLTCGTEFRTENGCLMARDMENHSGAVVLLRRKEEK